MLKFLTAEECAEMVVELGWLVGIRTGMQIGGKVKEDE